MIKKIKKGEEKIKNEEAGERRRRRTNPQDRC
jgi:hypothetical protein